MPGGLVEVGETLEDAARREVLEETSLTVTEVIFNRFHEIIMSDDAGAVERHFVLAMFVARCEDGHAVAGDDAAAVDWFTVEDLKSLPLTGSTEQFVLESRELLPRLAPT